MTTSLFSISHASFDWLWIDHILSGQTLDAACSECGARRSRLTADLEVSVECGWGPRWPDVVGCGAAPELLIVTGRVLEAWRDDHIGVFPVHKVNVAPPIPGPLDPAVQPDYFWIDGEQIQGALLDFGGSGYVVARHCSTCGRRIDNITETHKRHSAGHFPYAFVTGSRNGANLFTTDLSRGAFFCTDAVVECARKHRHTNFRFIPVEAGGATWSKGIDYLGKQWPVHHPLRQSEGKTLDEWLEQLQDREQRYEARCALLDLGKEAASAVPVLVQMFHGHDAALRREAAILLNAFGKLGIPIGPEGEAAAAADEERMRMSLGRPRDGIDKGNNTAGSND